jgi:hypothetical protein
MDQRTITSPLRGDSDGAMALTLPPAAIRGVGALLALAVAAAHVADQGGLTAFTAPDWLGWAYRLIEVGGVLVAGVLLWPRSGCPQPDGRFRCQAPPQAPMLPGW